MAKPGADQRIDERKTVELPDQFDVTRTEVADPAPMRVGERLLRCKWIAMPVWRDPCGDGLRFEKGKFAAGDGECSSLRGSVGICVKPREDGRILIAIFRSEEETAIQLLSIAGIGVSVGEGGIEQSRDKPRPRPDGHRALVRTRLCGSGHPQAEEEPSGSEMAAEIIGPFDRVHRKERVFRRFGTSAAISAASKLARVTSTISSKGIGDEEAFRTAEMKSAISARWPLS